jgi:hypothetical protein
VARHCLANAVRGYGRRRRLLDRLGNDESAHGRQIVDSPDSSSPGDWVHEALARLSPADQEVLRLTAWEELGVDEVAVALGCGTRAATMRLHRARRRLRAEIDRMHVTVPEERVVRWKADGSHTELVVATDPRHPGRPVVTDADPVPRTVEDGHVLSRRTYPPSWSDAPPVARPPHDADRLRAYLEEIDRTEAMDTPQLLDAVGELLNNWTLGTREDAALVRVLADAKGLRPAGAVTDRLGRQGQAYVYDDAAHSTRRMLILDPRSGAVLGIEETVTKDDPEYGVKAGDVMSYSAWMR